MKLLKISIITCIFCLSLGKISYSVEEKKGLPKIGFLKHDAYIRAGDNENFESLCKLKMGDPVKIIGERYSWYNVKLPKSAYLYIKSDYVDLSSEENIGIANAMRINLRAGPSTKYSMLGQVSKPQKLNIVGEGGGWYKIEPPETISGWIKSDHIRFAAAEEKKLPRELIGKPKRIKLDIKPTKAKGNLIFSTNTD